VLSGGVTTTVPLPGEDAHMGMDLAAYVEAVVAPAALRKVRRLTDSDMGMLLIRETFSPIWCTRPGPMLSISSNVPLPRRGALVLAIDLDVHECKKRTGRSRLLISAVYWRFERRSLQCG